MEEEEEGRTIGRHGGGGERERALCDLSGRGTTRAEDAQGTPTRSNISPSLGVYKGKLVYEEKYEGGRGKGEDPLRRAEKESCPFSFPTDTHRPAARRQSGGKRICAKSLRSNMCKVTQIDCVKSLRSTPP